MKKFDRRDLILFIIRTYYILLQILNYFDHDLIY